MAMGWADWINTASDVVDIASRVAGLFGQDRKDQDTAPVLLGSVQFVVDDQTVFAENTDPDYGTLLTYSGMSPQANGQIASVSRVQYLAPTQNPPPNTTYAYNCTSDLQNYLQGGVLSINGVANDAMGNPMKSALSFAIRSIAFGTAMSIAGGITASFGKDAQTGLYTLSIQSTGPSLQSSTVHVKGTNGQAFDGSMTFNNPDGKGLGDGTLGTIERVWCSNPLLMSSFWLCKLMMAR
jgi:hypothetical protein